MNKFKITNDPMQQLCRMVIDTKYDDLPDKVIDSAKRTILDTMAVTIAGSAMEGIPAVIELVMEKEGNLKAWYLSTGVKYLPQKQPSLSVQWRGL